jgi:hypothetical protein
VVYFNFAFILGLFASALDAKILDIRTGSLNKNKIRRKMENFGILLQSLFFNKRIILSHNLRKLLNITSDNTLILPLGSEAFYEGRHDYTELNLLYIGTLDDRRICDTIEGINYYLQEN